MKQSRATNDDANTYVFCLCVLFSSPCPFCNARFKQSVSVLTGIVLILPWQGGNMHTVLVLPLCAHPSVSQLSLSPPMLSQDLFGKIEEQASAGQSEPF